MNCTKHIQMSENQYSITFIIVQKYMNAHHMIKTFVKGHHVIRACMK